MNHVHFHTFQNQFNTFNYIIDLHLLDLCVLQIQITLFIPIGKLFGSQCFSAPERKTVLLLCAQYCGILWAICIFDIG